MFRQLASALFLFAVLCAPVARAEVLPGAGTEAAAIGSPEARAAPGPFSEAPRASAPRAQLWLGAGGAAATLVATPAAMLGGAWIGTWSSRLELAAAPALLFFLAVPPLAVAFAEGLVAGRLDARLARFGRTFWVTLGAHALVTTGAILLGANARNPLHFSLVTVAEVLLLPGVSAGARALWPAPDAVPTAAASIPVRPEEPRPHLAVAVPSVPLFAVALP